MKKYNTRPIDFAGCHPVIAEALKRGEAIECRVWDSDFNKEQEIEAWVCRYRGNSNLPYRSDSDTPWRYAEPIARKVRRIMPPERAIQVLIAGGWRFTSTGFLTGPGCGLAPEMYALMGGDVDGEANKFSWPDCIIEEVEDDE